MCPQPACLLKCRTGRVMTASRRSDAIQAQIAGDVVQRWNQGSGPARHRLIVRPWCRPAPIPGSSRNSGRRLDRAAAAGSSWSASTSSSLRARQRRPNPSTSTRSTGASRDSSCSEAGRRIRGLAQQRPAPCSDTSSTSSAPAIAVAVAVLARRIEIDCVVGVLDGRDPACPRARNTGSRRSISVVLPLPERPTMPADPHGGQWLGDGGAVRRGAGRSPDSPSR